MLKIEWTENDVPFVKRPDCFAFFLIQSAAVRDQDGLASRMRVPEPDTTSGTRKKPTPADYDEVKAGYTDAHSAYKKLAVRDFGLADGCDYAVITFSINAQEAFDIWWGEVEAEAARIETTDQAFCAYLLKSRKNRAALALTFHVLTHIHNGSFPLEVDSDAVLRAIGYMDYLLSHARRVFALGENRIFGLGAVVLGKDSRRKTGSGLYPARHQAKGMDAAN